MHYKFLASLKLFKVKVNDQKLLIKLRNLIVSLLMDYFAIKISFRLKASLQQLKSCKHLQFGFKTFEQRR